MIEIGLVMALATLLTIDLYLPGGLIEGSHDLATARTAGFTVLVLAQLFNCFNARSETTSAFAHLFANPWLWAAIGLSVLLQVAVVNFGPSTSRSARCRCRSNSGWSAWRWPARAVVQRTAQAGEAFQGVIATFRTPSRWLAKSS